MDKNIDSPAVIDRLGGTAAVADIFGIRPPSVSEWRRFGIPRARLMYLQLVRPDVFDEADEKRASPPPAAEVA